MPPPGQPISIMVHEEEDEEEDDDDGDDGDDEVCRSRCLRRAPPTNQSQSWCMRGGGGWHNCHDGADVMMKNCKNCESCPVSLLIDESQLMFSPLFSIVRNVINFHKRSQVSWIAL